MASDQKQLDFVLGQLHRAGQITARKMFGEYGIYSDGKLFALFCDNRLFVKPTDGGRTFAGDLPEVPPYPGAKNYFLVTEKVEDRDWLSELVRITVKELPNPKVKVKKNKPKK